MELSKVKARRGEEFHFPVSSKTSKQTNSNKKPQIKANETKPVSEQKSVNILVEKTLALEFRQA